MLMSAISAISDELERAHLTATGLPSVLPCRLSGMALVDETVSTWSLKVQRDGHQMGSPQAERICTERI